MTFDEWKKLSFSQKKHTTAALYVVSFVCTDALIRKSSTKNLSEGALHCLRQVCCLIDLQRNRFAFKFVGWWCYLFPPAAPIGAVTE